MKQRNKSLMVYKFDKKTNVPYLNLGDYTQTLAALNAANEKFILNDFGYINREDFESGVFSMMDEVNPNTKWKIVANGWYIHNEQKFKVPKNLKPLFTSIHLKSKTMGVDFINELKKFEPIGARDLDTLETLRNNGVKSYFSGCLTLGLPKRKEESKDGIIFVFDSVSIDGERIMNWKTFYKWWASEKIIDFLKQKYSIEKIKNAKFITQLTDLDTSVEDCFKKSEEMLNTLSKAELVVTTRIHSLMPSMAMGTTSLYIMQNNKDLRFKGLSKYWNYIDLTKYRKTKKDKDIIIKLKIKKGKIVNNESFRRFAKKEIKNISKWWNNN